MDAYRGLLWGSYFEGNFPAFPCPTCGAGVLMARRETLQKFEAEYSKLQAGEDWWDPDHEVSKFNVMLICDRQACGEVVAVLGDVSWSNNPGDIEDDGTPIGPNEWQWFLDPKCFNPPLSIVRVPDGVPESVVKSLRRASWNYWADRRSSANHLRAALECLLDHFQVPRKQNNSKRYLDLNSRIRLFEEGDAVHKTIFNALRVVGNLGSHGGDVERDALLDCFEIFEYVLDASFGNRKEKAAALAEALIVGGGKLS